ncbi:MAG: helix-turn-helix transcriptional regulator [Sporichthyaceae bacterium]
MPRWNTVFLGREAELDSGADLLRTRRVVTLTGSGGCGKTRLAVVLSERVACDWDEVVFVDLAPAGPGDVHDLVRGALQAAERIGATALDLVCERLSVGRTLLVLDNCEHVLEPAAELVDRIWAECAGATVLATSREPLGVEGEATYRVPSLAVPRTGGDTDCVSVRLFVDRAGLARAPEGFAPDELPAVVEICRHLDGIPLAIELAAAGCRAMTPRQILDRLQTGLEPLNAVHRTARPRHATLTASIDWSYRQLNERQQRIARTLAVFAGGFTLEAAGAVCDPADAAAAPDALGTLVDRSLLEPAAGEPPRFRLLQTIRQFLGEALASAGEEDDARARHARHVADVVANVGADLIGSRYTAAVARLDLDLPDLRIADDWLIEHAEFAAAVRMHAPLCLFWSRRHPAEGCRRTLRALSGGVGTDKQRGQAILTYMESAFFAGLVDDTLMGGVDEGREIAERLPPSLDKGEILTILGMLELCLLDDRGPDRVVEALRHLRAAGTSYRLVDGLWNMSFLAMFSGDTAGSIEWASESAAEAEALGHPHALELSPSFLGMALSMAGEFVEAEPVLRAGLHLLEAAGDHSFVYIVRALLARIAGARGEVPEALAELDVVARAATRDGQGFALGWALWAQACIEHAYVPMNEPLAVLDDAEELMAAEGGMWAWGLAWCRTLRAERLAAAGDLTGAAALVGEAEERTRHPLAARTAVHARLAAARVARSGGRDADRAAHEALQASSAAGFGLETVEALELVALLAAERGDARGATRLLAATASRRDVLGWHLGPNEAVVPARAGEVARAALEPSDFAEAWLQGTGMDLEQAVAYAARGRGERRRPDTGWDSLTPAEHGVLALAARGMRNAEIAATLFTTTATVKTHLTRIFRKLDVGNRAELVAYVARRGEDQPLV